MNIHTKTPKQTFNHTLKIKPLFFNNLTFPSPSPHFQREQTDRMHILSVYQWITAYILVIVKNRWNSAKIAKSLLDATKSVCVLYWQNREV